MPRAGSSMLAARRLVDFRERCYTDLTETTRAGYPVIEHVRRLVDGPIV
ncbi:MAG: hypothetical protein WA459_04030 [Stellaceae bacterium]